jgi:hypothetical protein
MISLRGNVARDGLLCARWAVNADDYNNASSCLNAAFFEAAFKIAPPTLLSHSLVDQGEPAA